MQLCHDTSMVNVLKMVLKRESAKEVIVLNYADYARLCNLFIGRHYFISFYVCILEDAVMRRVFTVVFLFSASLLQPTFFCAIVYVDKRLSQDSSKYRTVRLLFDAVD